MHNLPRPVSHRFVGREEETANLKRALHPGNAPAATQVVTQTVSGLGGIGKSSLALHYAHSHLREYTAVWWINAETSETITVSLAQLTARLTAGIDASTIASDVLAEWALGWLETHPGWLLVFDNATDPHHLAPYLARLTGGSHLVTSRLTHGWDALADEPLHLDVLGLEAAAGLLCHLTSRNDAAEHTAAAGLAAELGCLPLALEQAGTYVRRTRSTLSGYLERFRAQTARMLATPGNGDPHSTTIARTWRVTIDTIAGRDPLAVRLLQIMAWLAPNEIPRDLLDGLADEPGAEADALALLADFSMITLTETAAATHRLVQAVARTPDPDDPHRTEGAITEARATSTSLLMAALPQDPETNPTGWPRWRDLLPHIETHLTHFHTDTTDTALILHGTSRFLLSQRQPAPATAYAERAAAASARLHSEDHPITLACRHSLARAYQLAENLNQAISLHEQNLADSIRILGTDHPHTLIYRHSLAAAHFNAGNLARAIPLYEQTLTDHIRVLGTDHPDTLTSRHSLANAYLAAGDPDRAIPLHQQILTDRVRILGKDHPHTLNCCNDLAHSYELKGDLVRAVRLFRQTLDDRVRILGTDHPDTLASRNNLAGIYLAARNLRRAIPLYEQILTDSIRVLGEDHPQTLISRNNLAVAYKAAGDPDRAIPLHQQILTDRVRILGKDHPDTLASRNNLAHAYKGAGDLNRAIPLYEQTLTACVRVLGEDHPMTRTVRDNLRQARSDPA
ncbi:MULTISPECIES: FxSxx-COOH system tetratricopeptide repeat protein [Streptomyces]|uniref:FxSxx-COOH system tetratricopeptide repeat protein n=1 Tax=Streptomyces lycopersici TaxID=2974589 RepID=UPI0021CEEFC0|nr:FxSxx-COOH system tetratricopeptide repeat protein [Streptomyces sp. NEAU-383]